MKTKHLVAILLGLATLAFFAADATAMYNPATGTFMQRDPGPGGMMAAPRVGGGPAVGGSFIPRDPTAQYGDGPNLYQYVKGRPTIGTDPKGTDAWLLSDSGHASYRVQVRNAEGCVLGCLGVDYYAKGFMGDEDKGSSGKSSSTIKAVVATQGKLTLSYHPGDCSKTPYKFAGTAEQDKRLVDWSLKAAGKDSTWFGDYKAALSSQENAEGSWSTYSIVLGRTCVQFTYGGLAAYLGRPWLYVDVFAGWGAPGPAAVPGTLGEHYAGNFDADGNYTGEQEKKSEKEAEESLHESWWVPG